MKHRAKTFVLAGLIVSLLALVIARPWRAINQAVGIKVDTLAHEEIDSLIFDDVKVALPDFVSDSLAYTVEARQKKKAYLEEQSAILQKENQKLDEQLAKKRHSIQEKQQSLVSLDQIEKLLVDQKQHKSKPASSSAVNTLEVSELETELNKRTGGRSNSHP